MNRFLKYLLIGTLCLVALPKVSFAASASCDSNADTGNTICTCDTGTTSIEASGTSMTEVECNSSCETLHATKYTFDQCEGVDANGDPLFSNINQANVTPTLSEALANAEESFIVPSLNVQIPGFSGFSVPTKTADGKFSTVNFLAEYINALYGWVIGAAALVAVVMMMLGGLQYVLSRGKSKYIEKAKTRITNAITGLVLLLAAYNIAFLIDPNTTTLKSLNITYVEGLEYFPPDGEEESDAITPNSALTGASIPISGDFITGYSGAAIDADVLTALQTAAATFHTATGKNVVVTSAIRDLTKQATLFYNNCLANGGICSPSTCNPSSTDVVKKASGKYSLVGSYATETSSSAIISAIVSNANVSACPHTSAVALDAWCDDGGGDYRHDPDCQATLIASMIDAGFCRLSSEVWHFELNTKKVSTRSCSTSWNSAAYARRDGTITTPDATCKKWDFKQHYCTQKKI